MRARDIVLAVFGWCCAAALVFELAHGRGKSVADYAARMPALAIGQPIDSSDDAHVIWSGWMRWKDGVRRSVAVDPDIAFASAVARNDCTVTLAAKPVLPDGLRAQRATMSLNGAPPPALVEMTADGGLEPWESQYHPNERALAMTKADLLALPAALAGFNGFYLQSGKFTMINSLNILEVGGIGVLIVIAGLIWFLIRFFRRRRRARLA